MSKNKELKRNRQEFLMSFFDGDFYQEKEVNGWWLIKMWNGRLDRWEVHLYSKGSYENYTRGKEKYKELKDQQLHLGSI